MRAVPMALILWNDIELIQLQVRPELVYAQQTHRNTDQLNDLRPARLCIQRCTSATVSLSRQQFGSCPLSFADWIRLMMCGRRFPRHRPAMSYHLPMPVLLFGSRRKLQRLLHRPEARLVAQRIEKRFGPHMQQPGVV
jgi:hypothetical protein